ncbi:MAG: aldehyde dehydrogenase family protein [Gracilimonas sp.]|nr:aldehyde dehydrogenase family protein [Gracilimonas sp.]
MAGGKMAETEEEGYYIEPTVFADIDENARIAQEEIFGPVTAFIKAEDTDDALRIANGVDYALTGAYFSNDPKKLDRALREFRVGNLYINRKCTGALVGAQPFGGFKLSGTDAKAGGS